jgi:hypothetical protein
MNTTGKTPVTPLPRGKRACAYCGKIVDAMDMDDGEHCSDACAGNHAVGLWDMEQELRRGYP